ncbi:MAG: lecithin retinol acyltransferase family protein [Gammaproteobacteria bacterium]|nr:lecithin retinol acyltransferase family protein [Gammaproteobacteria bacterium]
MVTTAVSNPPRQYDQPLLSGQQPPLAAHLVSPRGFYFHHGVYAGDGRVIHYAGLSQGFRRGPVEEVSLERFAQGCGIWVRSTTPARFDREQIVERARSRLGEHRYRIFTNNCAHFCAWCLHGASRRTRIVNWRLQPGAVLLAACNTLARSLYRRVNPDRIPTVS